MSDDLVKQMNDARDFPANTCGASRHAAMIAEALCRGEDYPMLAEEPDHCGESIAATVAALWECRTNLAQQDDLVQAAVAAERERCARVRDHLESILDALGFLTGGDYELEGWGISQEKGAEIRKDLAAIRKGGE